MRKKNIPAKNDYYQTTVRKHKASSEVIKYIFTKSSQSQFQELLKWSHIRYRNNIIFSGISSKNSAHLAKWLYFPLESPSEAFKWIYSLSCFKSANIQKYNEFTRNVDFLKNDFCEIKKQANILISENMLSFSVLSTLLFSISKDEGLEAQRQWISKNLYVSNSSFVNVIFYFKGLASESGRDPEDIYNTLYRSLLCRIDDDSFSQVIGNTVLCEPSSFEKFLKISQLMANQPVIDQYEIAVDSICSNIHSLGSVDDDNVNKFLSLMKQTKDWRSDGIDLIDSKLDGDCIFIPLCNEESIASLREILGGEFDEETNERKFRTALGDKFLFAKNTPISYLASSSYVIRYSDNLDDFLQGVSRREIAQSFLSDNESSFSNRRRVPLRYDILIKELSSSLNRFERNELFRLISLVGISENKISDVLICLYDVTEIDAGAITYFPAKAFFKKFSEDDIIDIAIDPRIAIAISRIKQDLSEEDEGILYLSVEKFLDTQYVQKPSDLDSTEKPISKFLYEACTLDCLRQSLEFTSKLEVEDERLKILRSLAEIDSENYSKYKKEEHTIVGQQTVDELLQRYEIGKIHCDEKAILKWAKEELAAKIVRLKDFIDADILPVERDADIEFMSHISAGKEGAFIFKIPNNEALNIADSIITELSQKYALDQRHGIDSYLSLGMRHGALEEHLRTPLSNKNLLTSKGPLGYEPIVFWNQFFLENEVDNIGEELSKIIVKFSETYDNALKDIKDELIQVKRDDKPRGIIDLEWSQVEILTFSTIFSRVNNIDEFLEEFSKIQWQLVDQKLIPSRKKITGEVASIVLNLLNELECEVATATGLARLGPFSDAVTRAREDLNLAIQDLASWHNVTRSADTEPIALIDIISAAEKIVARLYPTFKPNLKVVKDKNITLKSSLNVLIEVFKALFINVYEHSGTLSPEIIVDIDIAVEDQLIITFSSSCNDLEAGEISATVANERISTGEYEKRLSKEGGSGLPKVARATVKDGRPNTNVSIDYDSKMFSVRMVFSLLNL